MDYRSDVDAGLLAGEQGDNQGRHTCFFAAVDLLSQCHTTIPLLSSEAKETLKQQRSVEGFELCILTRKVQCENCLRFSAPGHIFIVDSEP